MTTWETKDTWVVIFRPRGSRKICCVFDRKEDAVKDRKVRLLEYQKVTCVDEIPENREDDFFKVEKIRMSVFKSDD